MSFARTAKSLIQNPEKAAELQNPDNLQLDKSDILAKLDAAGFGHNDVFQELRNLYDMAEDDSTKRSILDMIIKMYGLYVNKEEKAAPPVININIKGNNDNLFHMLCPPLQSEAA